MAFPVLQVLFPIILMTYVSYGQTKCLENAVEYQEKYVKPILSSLVDKGYTVRETGYLQWKNESTHGASPSTTYGVYHFPNNSWPLIPTSKVPNAMLFHASDAIIFTGCTAPYVTYIDWTNYVYAKYNPINSNISVADVFGSLGASIHQYLLNVSYDYPTAPFDTMTTVIHTADKVTWKDIHQQYIKQNISDIVNLDYIPNQYFNFIPYNFTESNYSVLNYPGPLDSFIGMPRIVGEHFNVADYGKYVSSQQPAYWITAEKLVNKNSTTPREPFETVWILNQTSSRTELIYEQDFQLYINDVITYFSKTPYTLKYINRTTLINCMLNDHYYGFQCIENNKNCQGDDRAEQYWSTHNGSNVVRHGIPHGVFKIKNDSYYVLIGINHVATNQTIYDNVLLYCEQSKIEGLFEPVQMTINREYNNSCNAFNVPTTVSSDILSKFYMVQVGRPQTCDIYGRNTYNNYTLPGICIDESVVASDKDNVLNTLNLLHLETMTRPSQQQIIPPVMIEFQVNQ